MSKASGESRQRVLEVLRVQPSGLFTDIDGVLSSIAPTPEQAVVAPEARAALAALSRKLPLVAAVTGRAAEYARLMVDLPDVLYIGNHGLEEYAGGEVRVILEVEPHVPRIRDMVTKAEAQVHIPGVIVEDKGVTASVHYRQTTDPARSRDELLRLLKPLADETGTVLYDGRMVIEIRPPVPLGKGAAIRRVTERLGLRGCVYMGDDVTDVDGFRVLRELRAQGIETVSVGVLSPEVPAAVRDESDVTVDGVAGVIDLLQYVEGQL